MSTRTSWLIASVMLLVIAGQGPATAESPTLSLEPMTGPPTTPVEVSGTGFLPEEVVDLAFGTKARGMASVDATGAFSATIGVPRSATEGAHEVTATGETSSLVAGAPFTVVLPSIALSRTIGPPMAYVTVTGASFRSLEPVEVAFDWKTVEQATADQAGYFSTTMRVPKRAQTGLHVLSATGGVSGLVAEEVFSVRIDDWPQYGFDAAHSGHNPREDVLDPANVADLTSAWTVTVEPGGGLATGFSSPAVVKGVVYIGTEDGTVYALDAWTGAVRWSHDTGFTHNWSSPAVARGAVYIGGGNLVALRASTGAVVWKVSTGGDDSWTPTVAHGVVYTISRVGPTEPGTEKLYAVRASDGSILWTKKTGYAGDSVTGQAPTVANGVVYVGSASQELYALDAETGKVRWTVPMGEETGVTPAVVDGVAYAPSVGHLRALDASTGEVLWTTAVTGGASSPAVEDGIVVLGGEGASGFDATTGTLLWNAPIGYCAGSSPAIANGVVYVSANPGNLDEYTGNLYAIDALNGQVLWSAPVGSLGGPDPRVVNGMAYSGSEDGLVYAFALP
jgi:outer membrane protein assembly factor BamB